MHLQKRRTLIGELGFRPEAFAGLAAYIDLLWKANADLNLISRKMTMEELVDNHVIDCLLPLVHFPPGIRRAVDFGAGGGLPGVVYALQFPETEYVLYEKSPRKREFLETCRSLAPNLRVAAEVPRALPTVDLVTARAFKPIDVLLDMSRDYFKSGGRYFLLKGREEKIREEETAAKRQFPDLEIRVRRLTSPLLEVERHLVEIGAPAGS